jgi:hypothetical protein
MAKADVLEMVNDLFELVLNGTEHFLTNEARCLGHYEAYAKERILIFEKKYEPITGALLLKGLKVRALLQDSKSDPIVRNCNRILAIQPQFQHKMSSWEELSPIFDALYKAHVEYEASEGEVKFIARNKRQLLLLNGSDVPEKEAAGGPRKKAMTMVAAAGAEKVVSFAKKDEAGAQQCGSCGLSHSGQCTQQANKQIKYERAAPFVQRIKVSTTAKQEKAAVEGLIDSLDQNARRPSFGRGFAGRNGAAGVGGTGAGRGRGSPGVPGKGGNPPLKVDELSVGMVQVIKNHGHCIGHAKGNCLHGDRCKFKHSSKADLRGFVEEAAAMQKAAVAMAADGKKNALTGKPQGKTAPVMTSAPKGGAGLGALLTEMLNEVAMHDGAAAISGQDGVHGFGLGWLLVGEEVSMDQPREVKAQVEAVPAPEIRAEDFSDVQEAGDDIEVAQVEAVPAPEIRVEDFSDVQEAGDDIEVAQVEAVPAPEIRAEDFNDIQEAGK